jgi:hypothetical protein
MKITLNTNHPVAYESIDHLVPYGTRVVAHRNPRFNFKLYKMWPFARFLTIMDMGCGGGQFVKDCFDAGHLAVGIDGSDWSKKHKREAWRDIPEYLFTCDAAKPFQVEFDGQPAKFDVITSWEFFEHVNEQDVNSIMHQMAKHLADGGVWINSINGRSCFVGGHEYHQTIKPRAWWLDKFKRVGLEENKAVHRYFAGQWVSGPRQGYCAGSFHICVGLPGKQLVPPKLGLLRWLYDTWKDSKAQKFLCCDA